MTKQRINEIKRRTHELYREMIFRNRENKKIFNDSQKGEKTNER